MCGAKDCLEAEKIRVSHSVLAFLVPRILEAPQGRGSSREATETLELEGSEKEARRRG